MKNWIVYKFGGSSVADAEAFVQVADLVAGAAEGGDRVAVVVSAVGGVTDRLQGIIDTAAAHDESYTGTMDRLNADHRPILESLLGAEKAPAVQAVLDADAEDMEEILRAIFLCRSYSKWMRDQLLGYGELWSSRILSAYLASRGIDADWVDTRDIITVGENGEVPLVDWDASGERFSTLKETASVLVFPGFVARDAVGRPATLGRNGSDYSASIIARLAHAKSVTIWTDVEGILSADPRKVPETVFLETVSYQEAMELAFFGAKVLHPQAISPAIAGNIPVWIKSTFKPESRGTCIRAILPDEPPTDMPVKGFSTIDGISLINVEGRGMVGVPGIAERLFTALHRAGISVIMISQASSEHSICFAVPEDDGAKAKATMEETFSFELDRGRIQSVSLMSALSIIAVVGDGMAHRVGVAATFFGSLGKAGVNIRGIAQGSSERNISAVIDSADATRALRAVHSGFFLSNQTLSVGIVGHGSVGGELLRQLNEHSANLHNRHKIDIRVRGITNSRKMILGEKLDLADWRKTLEASESAADLDAFADFIQADHIPHSVIVDCTASGAVAERYGDWLERKIHVITPNKRAGSGPLDEYHRIMKLGKRLNSHFLYEGTVGAGLPVITTLRDLIQTGDRIHRIEGVFSGTLSYIFNSISDGATFPDAVREAKERNYTEPDPREDLSGLDVARKTVILAREMGIDLQLENLPVHSLIPAALEDCADVDTFMADLPNHDPGIAKLKTKAESQGKVLRYVGVADPGGKSEVAIRSYDRTHPFASLVGTDNIIAFYTDRYAEQPLIVQGPGAGREVTAAGVFADLLRLAAYIGAPSPLV